MVEIPLYMYTRKHYPLTPKSTITYWAKQSMAGKGPLAGKVNMRGHRYYIIIAPEAVNARQLADQILAKLEGLNDV